MKKKAVYLIFLATLFLYVYADDDYYVRLKGLKVEQAARERPQLSMTFVSNLPEETRVDYILSRFVHACVNDMEFREEKSEFSRGQFKITPAEIKLKIELHSTTLTPLDGKLILSVLQIDENVVQKIERKLLGKQLGSFFQMPSKPADFITALETEIRQIWNLLNQLDLILSLLKNASEDEAQQAGINELKNINELSKQIDRHKQSTLLVATYDYFKKILVEFEMACQELKMVKEAEKKHNIASDPTDEFDYTPDFSQMDHEKPGPTPKHPLIIESGVLNTKYLKSLMYKVNKIALREANAWFFIFLRESLIDFLNLYEQLKNKKISQDEFFKALTEVVKEIDTGLIGTSRVLTHDIKKYLKNLLELEDTDFITMFRKEFNQLLNDLKKDIEKSNTKERLEALKKKVQEFLVYMHTGQRKKK